MTVDQVVAELKAMGSEGIKKIFLRHGAKEPVFGVKVGDLKKIQKRVKKDHALALALFDTGISEAMYLAGLISDPPKMTRAQLQKWAKKATWPMTSEYTVPWVAAESLFGAELAREWIDSPKESIALSGWATWSSLVAIKPDEELDLDELADLLDRVATGIHQAPNRVRYVMNGFVIAVGSYMLPLAPRAKAAAEQIGHVKVDMGETDCKVPNALEYIRKVEKSGRAGVKRKTAMC
ncbi:MAG TPA: DNA alkylation repair protein [Gemmataceae bacterium]|nr:DNA alkylation repair protein [Gemmataceae bacterium]